MYTAYTVSSGFEFFITMRFDFFVIIRPESDHCLLLSLREGSGDQIGWIFGKIPNGLWPPFIFKIILQIFYNGYGCIYARRYEGQIVWNACTWFPEIGTILIFLNTIVEKTYPEPWIYSFFISSDLVAGPFPYLARR